MPSWHSPHPLPSSPHLSPPLMALRRLQTLLSLKIASILIIDIRSEALYTCGGSIRGSLHIPATGFWWNRGVLYELCYKSDVEWVCFVGVDGDGDEEGDGEGGDGEGDGERGRMSRAGICAGWFLDHVRNTAQDGNMQILVLEGDLGDWVEAGAGFVGLMDGFDGGYWEERRKVKSAGMGVEEKGEEGMKEVEVGDKREEDMETKGKKRRALGDDGRGGGDEDGTTVDDGAAADAGKGSKKKQKTTSAADAGEEERAPEFQAEHEKAQQAVEAQQEAALEAPPEAAQAQ